MSLTIHSVYDLWESGYDTLDIATMVGRSEADIHHEVNQCRSAILGKAYPYAPYMQPTALQTPAPMKRNGLRRGKLDRRNRTMPEHRQQRNASIMAMREARKTFFEIAEAHSISPQRVHQIVKEARP